MLKKVWGVIFIILGVISFLFGGYKYFQTDNFVNMINAFGFSMNDSKMNNFIQQNINAAYQESYIFLGIGIFLALIGSVMLKKNSKE